MAFGPTQNYDDVSMGVWKGRPVLAGATRALIVTVPLFLSVNLGVAAVRWFPPSRLGMNPWVWLTVEVVCATVVLVLATRVGRKLLPLTTLLRLTLYFPDRAPSRLAVAMRHYSPNTLPARLAVLGRHRDLRPEDHHAARILGLVAAIGDHDQLTRGHCERVQAYSALIGKELGLSEHEAAKLSWAALLHDIGKLRVPAEVLSKPGKPTALEWQILAGHPQAGMEIAQPLARWLGPWLDAIGQHHESWDGAGYPNGLAGTAISAGARIVAVADAYDTITCARSYKKALPASAARAELARCSGQQFDPEVVRALLAVGLGRLRRVAGPLSVLSALPGLHTLTPDLPSLVRNFTTAGALKSAGAIGLVLSISTSTTGGALAGTSHTLPNDAPLTRPMSELLTPRQAPTFEAIAVPPPEELVSIPLGPPASPGAPPQPTEMGAAAVAAPGFNEDAGPSISPQLMRAPAQPSTNPTLPAPALTSPVAPPVVAPAASPPPDQDNNDGDRKATKAKTHKL